MKEYTVYIHKNLKNDKYYVGSTSQNPKKRWESGWGYQNNSKMWSDIRNSDWNTDWVHGILGKFENKKDALNYEAFLIAMLDSVENGYNISPFNNSSYKKTEEHRKKLSESLSGEKNYWYGKHLSEETKKKMAEAHGVNGILQFSKTGEFIAEYPSAMEASRKTGCNHSHIGQCCKGKLKSAGGYAWRYAS